jgi:hypothetical protein
MCLVKMILPVSGEIKFPRQGSASFFSAGSGV